MSSPRTEGAEECDNCGRPIDDCQCRCPYCGEIEHCDCAIGLGVATGGG